MSPSPAVTKTRGGEDRHSGSIEPDTEISECQGHTDRVAESLSERTGCRLHSYRVAVFRVSGGLTPPLPE